jgi:hypothetical protein
MDLLDKVIYRIETEAGWDQALFNECIFFPNSPGNKVRLPCTWHLVVLRCASLGGAALG